ncbi:MAG TPA: FHA domain-containing protein, partial [Vicinamibacteria bacterium]
SIGPRDQVVRRRLAEGVLRALPPGSELAIFAFDDQPRMVLPRTADRDEVASAVARLRNQGRYTALYDAVFDASRYLAEQPAGRKGILLVTDGVDENSAVNLEDALATAREQAIPVVAIGIGKVQERVLRRMAKLTGGDYFPASVKPAVVADRIGSAAERLAAKAPSRGAAPARGPAEVPRERAVAPPAAPSPVAPAPGAPAGARPAEAPSRVAAPAPWLIALPVAAVLLLAAVVGLVMASRRKAATAVVEAPTALRRAAATPAPAPQYPESDEEMEVLRPEGFGGTLVLTLLPLLRVVKGPEAGKMFEVAGDKPTTLGRAKDNDVPIDDRAVSNRHCRIRPADGGLFEIVDLKSTNGTFVNRRRVSRQPLAPGDVIKIGESTLEFRMDHLKDE